MQVAVTATFVLLAMIVLAAAPRYVRAWRVTGNAFGLFAAALCFALALWLLFAAYWLGTLVR